MKNFFEKKRLLVFILILVAFFVGWQVGLGQEEIKKVYGLDNKATPENISVDFSYFWKAWNLIDERYVATGDAKENVSSEERVWGAIKGLADSLEDPYTVFLSPEETERFESDISGNFEGVGMEVGMRDDILTVIAPLKNTPAYNAGIIAGDKILKIDDVSTNKLSINEAVNLIRGERGTEVVFTILREGLDEALEISVKRDVIDFPVIDTEVAGDGDIFVIKLYSFSSNSPEVFSKALEEYNNSGLNKLILDLRGNPGGFLQASVEISSWFLPAGKIIVEENYNGNRKNVVHRSRGYGSLEENEEMIVLIDEGSASASEIVAGALAEHGIATLVGSNTFGKGSVQELVSVSSDTKLKVTVAEWLTPFGNSFSEEGLEPEYVVERTYEDILEEKDPQMDKAVELLYGSY